jgi:putative two-component system response regulator
MDANVASKTILVIDDAKENLTVIGELLQPYYHVKVANSGMRGIKAAANAPQPDLILLDVMMPEMDGYAVIRELHSNPQTRNIPVIFVTAMDAEEDEELGFRLGALDYLTKPIRPSILLARVRTQIELKEATDMLKNQNAILDEQIQLRIKENELIKDVSLNALALLAEKRDNETGAHLYRTQAYVEALMLKLCDHPRFVDDLQPKTRKMIVKAVPLHDIGKVGIPDQILLKPGKLTPEEFEIIKTHTQIGGDAILEAVERVSGACLVADNKFNANAEAALDFLKVACQVALYHHEKWDGSGYPFGMRGDTIPVAARFMALADVFDALTCKRHYKPAFTLEATRTILLNGRGTHFDPDIVDAYFAIEDQFIAIADRFKDKEKAQISA